MNMFVTQKCFNGWFFLMSGGDYKGDFNQGPGKPKSPGDLTSLDPE
jgi:hypothetical protein